MASAVRVYVVTYGSAVPHLVFIMPAGGHGRGGPPWAAVSHNFSLFTLFLCPLSTTAKKWKRRKRTRGERGGRTVRGPPILPRLFLPLSRPSGERACGRGQPRCRSSCLPLAQARYILNAAKWMRWETRRYRLPFTAVSCNTGSILRNVLWSFGSFQPSHFVR